MNFMLCNTPKIFDQYFSFLVRHYSIMFGDVIKDNCRGKNSKIPLKVSTSQN
jgi:hypothetical protein